jgi:lipase chaperone LimK
VADNTIPSPSHSTWREFFAKRDRILAEQPNEIKEFMSARSQLREQHFRDPFEGWKE